MFRLDKVKANTLLLQPERLVGNISIHGDDIACDKILQSTSFVGYFQLVEGNAFINEHGFYLQTFIAGLQANEARFGDIGRIAQFVAQA